MHGGAAMSYRSEKIFVFLEMFFYLLGSIELLVYNKSNVTILLVCIIIVILNSLFRHLLLDRRENGYKYSIISIIFQIIVVSYMMNVSNQAVITLFFCPIIFELALIYSLYLSTIITIIIAVLMFSWYSTVVRIDSITHFILNCFSSFGLALLLMFILGYLIKIQLREKKKVIRVNRELEEAYQRLLDKSSENQELSIEKERLRMAREIHDTLAHTLTAVVVQMEACKRLLKVDSDRVLDAIEEAQKYTRDGLNDVKRTIKALRPQILENGTFFDALLNQVEDVKHNMDIDILLDKDEQLDIPSSMEVPLYRVIQESITNAIRHGKPTEIQIDIFKTNNYLHINIKDNGRGCNLIKEGFGLKGISERIKAINGVVDYYSTVGEGFETKIRVPFEGDVHFGN